MTKTSDLWVEDAIQLPPSAPGGTTSDFPDAGPHMVWHTTQSPAGAHNGDPNYWFKAMQKVLTNKSAESTLLYDPLTDRLGQFFPSSQTARALANDGSKRTNRTGVPCLQIEVIGWAERPFTRTWKPGPNFAKLGDFLEANGVPYRWPSGMPPAYPNEHDERGDVYYRAGGHYGHSQVPGNSHGDPGEIEVPLLFNALCTPTESEAAKPDPEGPGTPGSRVWPAWKKWPGYDKLGWGRGQVSSNNLLISAALAAHGYQRHVRKSVDRHWSNADAAALDLFKRDNEIREGGVGPKTWRALGKMPPKKDTPKYPGVNEFEMGQPTGPSLRFQSLLVLQGFGRALDRHARLVWTPGARLATRRFQLSEPLLSKDADGVPGPLTWKKAWQDDT